MGSSKHKNDKTPIAPTSEVSNLSATSKELTMKSIATTESAIKQGMQVIKYNSDPVVTTEQLAAFYDADKKQISNNFLRNSTRFTAGKHFYKLQGDVLKDFKNHPSQRGLVNKKSSHLILWTERGAARHAKMLETNRAWDVYEQLEDCYFTQKEKIEAPRKKTTVDERTPLRDAVNMLVGKKGLRYDDAYNMVHQRFAIDSIDELELSQIPLAVEYIHRIVLEGEFIGRSDRQIEPDSKSQYRYLTKVTIADNLFGGEVEFIGAANDFNKMATGICTTLGLKPLGFSHVDPQFEKMKRIH